MTAPSDADLDALVARARARIDEYQEADDCELPDEDHDALALCDAVDALRRELARERAIVADIDSAWSRADDAEAKLATAVRALESIAERIPDSAEAWTTACGALRAMRGEGGEHA